MHSAHSKTGLRRKRCSFVKVDPSESHNSFGNEVNAQLFSTILPILSAGFHGGPSTPRPGGSCISHLEMSPWKRHKNICWWMLHITFCSVSKLRRSMDTLENNNNNKRSKTQEPGKKKKKKLWIRKHIKVDKHKNLHERYLTNTSFVATWASSCSWVSVSYLMDDLRHWQLVCVRVHLFLLLSIYRTEKQTAQNSTLWAFTQESKLHSYIWLLLCGTPSFSDEEKLSGRGTDSVFPLAVCVQLRCVYLWQSVVCILMQMTFPFSPSR